MIDFERIANHPLHQEPYRWAAIDRLFSADDATLLAKSFPRDRFKTVSGYGGEKDYEYEARELIAMGASEIAHPRELSFAWVAFARDLLSSTYRSALSRLTGCDLRIAPLEVNVFHYGAGSLLGPHADLPDKIVTHIFYFNESWNRDEGGCLSILRSADPGDVAAEIRPLVGNSAVLVRSDNSWHAVSRVDSTCRDSRRSLTATFYRPGSVSTMWPPSEAIPLHRYNSDGARSNAVQGESRWSGLRRRLLSRSRR